MIDDELKRRASYTFQSDIITMRGKRTKWIYTDKKDQRFKESLDFQKRVLKNENKAIGKLIRLHSFSPFMYKGIKGENGVTSGQNVSIYLFD